MNRVEGRDLPVLGGLQTRAVVLESGLETFFYRLGLVLDSRFKVQGFFICHIIVIQGITRSEMQSNQVRSVDSAKQ